MNIEQYEVKLPSSVVVALKDFHHRKLETGELVLLGKAIADTINITGKSEGLIGAKVAINNLNEEIYELYERLNKYTYLSKDDKDMVKEVASAFLAWRLEVAFNPPTSLNVSGEYKELGKELSGLHNYIDPVTVSEVTTILPKASHTYSVFRELAKIYVGGDKDES